MRELGGIIHYFGHSSVLERPNQAGNQIEYTQAYQAQGEKDIILHILFQTFQ
jgi:hypothetical protein